MTLRLSSIRIWLLAAMLVAGVVGLVGARLAITRIEQNEEEVGDRAKDLRIAQAVAADAAAGAGVRQFKAIQSVLPYDQILVSRDGQTIFAGPEVTTTAFELEISVPFPGGEVVVRDYNTPDARWPLGVTLVVGALLVLVIGAALVAASVLARALREPIDRAVTAADRVAAGDLQARIGDVAPEELDRLASAFDSMAARLETADHHQREFLADVAHEIATPVNAIAGLAGALADGTVTSSEERQEAAALIDTETARLGSLLDDLRRLTKPDLAEPVRRDDVDLGDLCRSIRARFRLSSDQAGVELSVNTDEHMVVTDRRLLETVIDNLVSNAIRYTPSGGNVNVRATRQGTDLEISVADTGIGIDHADLERVFDRFYRVDRARDRASGGTGLGLALARRASQALGARINVSSRVGIGTEFVVVLPTQDVSAQDRETELSSDREV